MLRIPACDGNFPELISAVMAGRVELVRSLCFAGVAHIQDSDGLTALWHASRSGLPEMVEVLLETGPFNDARELCVTDLNGRTSLIVRVLGGNLILVRSLLKTSLVAQVMIPDKNGWLPCEHAVFWSHALGRDDVAKRMVNSLNEAAIKWLDWRDDVHTSPRLTTQEDISCFQTVLQAATEVGHSGAVKSLIELWNRISRPVTHADSSARFAFSLERRRLPLNNNPAHFAAAGLPPAIDTRFPEAVYLAALQQHEGVLTLLLRGQNEMWVPRLMERGLKLRAAYLDATSRLVSELGIAKAS
jgi:ankyrin repeat protein